MMNKHHMMDAHYMMNTHYDDDIEQASYVGQQYHKSATFLRGKMYDGSPSHLATHQSSETFSYQIELSPWLQQTSYLPH